MSARDRVRKVFELRHQVRKHSEKKSRVKKPRSPKEKPAFAPPSGYYQGQVIAERNHIAYSSVKRYVAAEKVRAYRVGRNAAYCEYDVILAIEEGKKARIENGRKRGRK